MQSLVQKEGKAHNEDTAKADRKIKLPEKTHEGKTPDQKAAEIVKEKAKPKRKKNTATLQYPLNARINGYNFMHFSNALLADLGWHVDMMLKVDKNADGSITLRKA